MSDCCPSCGYPESENISCGYCEAYPEVRGPIDSIQEMARRVLFYAKAHRNSLRYKERHKHKIEAHEIDAAFTDIINLCQGQIPIEKEDNQDAK